MNERHEVDTVLSKFIPMRKLQLKELSHLSMITKCLSLGSTESKRWEKGLQTGSLFRNVILGSETGRESQYKDSLALDHH